MLPAHQREQLEALHGGAYGWALLCCGRDRDRAADVLQTSYARVIGGEATFSGRSSLRSFLFGVVKRVALEEQRARRRSVRRDQIVGAQAAERQGAPAPESALEHSELQDRIRLALLQLPTRQREVLHLRFYEEVTLEAAAEILGIGLGSARKHYERGKAALRQHCGALKEHVGTPPAEPRNGPLGKADIESRRTQRSALGSSYERP